MRRRGQPIRHARDAFAARLLLFGIAVLIPGSINGEDVVVSTVDLMERLGVEQLSDGASSSDDRDAALRRIPTDRMTDVNRQRLTDVTSAISQYRKLPTMRYEVHPETYRYFIEHPDVAVSLWGVMGISKFTMWQTGPMEYEADTGDGSEGIADILYRDDNQTVALCSGKYSSPFLLKPLQASAIIHARYRVEPTEIDTQRVVQELDVFISFPSQTVAAVAKVISPITSGIMDRNVLELSMFARMMCQATQERPGWVCGMADQMKNVLPQRPIELKALCEADQDFRRQRIDAQVSEFLRTIERPAATPDRGQRTHDGAILYLSPAQLAAAVPVPVPLPATTEADNTASREESRSPSNRDVAPLTPAPPVPRLVPSGPRRPGGIDAVTSSSGWRKTRPERRGE